MAEDISQKFLFEQVLLLADEVLKIKNAIRNIQIKLNKNNISNSITDNMDISSNIRDYMISQDMVVDNNTTTQNSSK